ncbi:MAG: hypothetical protein J0I77_05465 [Rudaea sp.]|uniref:hypothetical protein n=1 Tax=unclassified Rudaea TaxID=2627037 RepID=UPI0010F8E796|nr:MULTISPECIES: hypothetical protein [unclassified Rudaea]MBN8885147.1 hypothetical protein [Rudaea sp.]MBR0345754.1 hypothetical protein [Rudaea sp.]
MAFSGKGWLPVDFSFQAMPSLLAEATVRWLHVGDRALSEPFMEHTIDSVRKANPAARLIDTSLDTLLWLGEKLERVQPSGFIFHVSHCGSTLVANAMRHAPGTIVVSESRAITRLMRPYFDPGSVYLRQRWHDLRRKLIEALFRAFSHYLSGTPAPLIVKFTSVDILALSLIRAWWPQVPCVVVVRNPVEVMVANLAGGWWMELKGKPALAREILGWPTLSSVDLGDEEFCARMYATFIDAARAGLDSNCRVVDYDSLDAAGLRRVAHYFGLPLPDDSALTQTFAWYSKDADRQIAFADDRQRKRAMASMAVVDAAERWAQPAYNALRSSLHEP